MRKTATTTTPALRAFTWMPCLLLAAACATPAKPPSVQAEVPEETPIVTRDVVRNLKNIAVIVSATSRAEYETKLANMQFDFRPSSHSLPHIPTASHPGMAGCLIPPFTLICIALDAAISGAINSAVSVSKNAERREKEKEIFDRDQALTTILSQEDFPSLVLDRLTALAATRKLSFASSMLSPATPPGTMPAISASGAWDALLVLQVSNPYVHEWPNARQSRAILPITAVGLSYTATLFTMPQHAKLADMYRFVSLPMNPNDDRLQSMRSALSGAIDDMARQIDKAIIAPLAQRTDDTARTEIMGQPANDAILQPEASHLK
jgi:hypothetical protein